MLNLVFVLLYVAFTFLAAAIIRSTWNHYTDPKNPKSLMYAMRAALLDVTAPKATMQAVADEREATMLRHPSNHLARRACIARHPSATKTERRSADFALTGSPVA